MVNEKLIKYIRENLRKGYPLDSLRQALINEGWDIDEVDEAIDIVQTPKAPTVWPEEVPPPPRSFPVAGPPSSRMPPRPEQGTQPERPKPSRPIGVTIISIIGFLGAILVLLVGLLSLGLAGFMGDISLPGMFGNETASITIEGFGSLLTLLGVAFVIMGVFELIGFYMLLRMKRKGWLIVSVLGVIQIVGYLATNLTALGMDTILIIVVWIVIIGYLFARRKVFV